MKNLLVQKATMDDSEAMLAFRTGGKGLVLGTYSPEDSGTAESLREQIGQSKPYEGTYLIRDAQGRIIASCTFYGVLFRNRFTFLHMHLAQTDDLMDCLACFVEFAFDQLDFHKINVYLSEDSTELFAPLARLGFRMEVRLREHLRSGDGFQDVLHLGLLRTDYPCAGLVPAEAPAVEPLRKNTDHLLKSNVTPDRCLLQGEKVSLTMIDREDLDGIYAQMRASNAEQFSSIAATGPRSRHSIQWLAEKRNDYFGLVDDMSFAIRKTDSGEVIGTIGSHFVDLANSSLMLGISILQAGERSRGFGSESIRLFTDFAFLELNMHRVYLGCFAFNLRAAALYERLGFVREGINRSFVYRNGNYYDEIAFGVTKAQWLAARGYLDTNAPGQDLR